MTARLRLKSQKISDRRQLAMGLALVSASTGDRTIRRLLGGLLLLLGVLMRTGPALAGAQSDGFAATVRVDATADSVAAAREAARVDGQRRALVLVIDRASGSGSGSADSAKLAKLDDKTITDMVESFEVANERMSAVRYLADYTFHFRSSKVRRLIHVDSPPAEATNKPVAVEGSSKPLTVLPVYRDAASAVLWDDPNAWRAVWEQRSADSGPVRMIVPLGDASDLAVIDAARAEAGKPDALAAIARRNGGDEAIVALATTKRDDDRLVRVDLNIKRYRSGRLVDTYTTSLDANSGENPDDFLRRAADSIASEIANGSKKARSDQQASLAASVPIGSIGEWVTVRDKLASVPSIRRVDLLSLNRHEAKIQIKYVGNPDQLKSSLGEVDLGLDGTDPVWRLQPSGAAGAR
jgi:Uncharacterized protein conserved in bacteria (DUF2066)